MNLRLDRKADGESRPARGDAAPNAAGERKGPMVRLEMPLQSIENVQFGDGDGAMQATGFSANWPANAPSCETPPPMALAATTRRDTRFGGDRGSNPVSEAILRGDAKRGRKLLKFLGAAAKLALKP